MEREPSRTSPTVKLARKRAAPRLAAAAFACSNRIELGPTSRAAMTAGDAEAHTAKATNAMHAVRQLNVRDPSSGATASNSAVENSPRNTIWYRLMSFIVPFAGKVATTTSKATLYRSGTMKPAPSCSRPCAGVEVTRKC